MCLCKKHFSLEWILCWRIVCWWFRCFGFRVDESLHVDDIWVICSKGHFPAFLGLARCLSLRGWAVMVFLESVRQCISVVIRAVVINLCMSLVSGWAYKVFLESVRQWISVAICAAVISAICSWRLLFRWFCVVLGLACMFPSGLRVWGLWLLGLVTCLLDSADRDSHRIAQDLCRSMRGCTGVECAVSCMCSIKTIWPRLPTGLCGALSYAGMGRIMPTVPVAMLILCWIYFRRTKLSVPIVTSGAVGRLIVFMVSA